MVKNPSANEGDVFKSLVWEDPWRRKWQPTPVSLPGESHGGWHTIVHRVAKSQTWLSNWTTTTNLCRKHHILVAGAHSPVGGAIGAIFLWEEPYSCGRSRIPVGRAVFLWEEPYSWGRGRIPVGGAVFLGEEPYSWGRSHIPVGGAIGAIFLWEEPYSCGRSCIPMGGAVFLGEEPYSKVCRNQQDLSSSVELNKSFLTPLCRGIF